MTAKPLLYDGIHRYRVDTLYQIALDRVTDMQVHVPILRELARGKRVLELGVRYGVSTAAFLAGRPSLMVSVDKEPFVYQESYQVAAMEIGVLWRFLQQDSTQAELINSAQAKLINHLSFARTFDQLRAEWDVVFFDTTHTYDHLRRELNAYALGKDYPKMLIFHDTILFWDHDDAGWPSSDATGPTGPGIGRAVTEFRSTYPEWRVTHERRYPTSRNFVPLTPDEHYALGCGLLVLERD